MLNVLLTLAAGLLSQLLSNSDFVQVIVYDYSYPLYKISIAAIYLSFSSCCVNLAVVEVDNHRNKSALLVSVLCFCMLTTSILNIVMINETLFYILTEYKSGGGLSWKNIYRAVELVAIIMVITNGIKLISDFGFYSFFLGKCANNINQSNFKG